MLVARRVVVASSRFLGEALEELVVHVGADADGVDLGLQGPGLVDDLAEVREAQGATAVVDLILAVGDEKDRALALRRGRSGPVPA